MKKIDIIISQYYYIIKDDLYNNRHELLDIL